MMTGCQLLCKRKIDSRGSDGSLTIPIGAGNHYRDGAMITSCASE